MKIRVLVVDDEAPICEWLVYCIKKASPNYEVIAASNGEEAFARILQTKPDVVFTDIRMPDMDGLELMRRVLEKLPFTVFAILTNHAEFSYAKQALSLGAREYFLKSELRAADIEALLAGIFQRKSDIQARKNQDVLPGGCVDLYELYKNQEQPGFADSFWGRQGMEEGKPYRLVCVRRKNEPESWTPLVALAREINEEGGWYAVVARERDYHYFLLQAMGQKELDARAGAVAAAVGQRVEAVGVGVSEVFTRRESYPAAAKQAMCAQNSLFFSGGGTVWYGKLTAPPALDREALSKQKQGILALAAQHRYPYMGQELAGWFGAFEGTGAKDVAWGIDACRRMVVAVEELYANQAGLPAVPWEIQQSLEDCRAWCQELAGRMADNYKGRHSPPIETALQYIHDHYSEPISMAEVARQIYRSPEYFSRQFKEEVGENFSVYLTLYRLDRAQELLRETGLFVSQVAERVGYTTPGYFSRLYKKYKGITPEQERGSKY